MKTTEDQTAVIISKSPVLNLASNGLIIANIKQEALTTLKVIVGTIILYLAKIKRAIKQEALTMLRTVRNMLCNFLCFIKISKTALIR